MAFQFAGIQTKVCCLLQQLVNVRFANGAMILVEVNLAEQIVFTVDFCRCQASRERNSISIDTVAGLNEDVWGIILLHFADHSIAHIRLTRCFLSEQIQDFHRFFVACKSLT